MKAVSGSGERVTRSSRRFQQSLAKAVIASEVNLSDAQSALSASLSGNDESLPNDLSGFPKETVESGYTTNVSNTLSDDAEDDNRVVESLTKQFPKKVTIERDSTKESSPEEDSSTSVKRVTRKSFPPRAIQKEGFHSFSLPVHITQEQILSLLPSPEIVYFDTETTGIHKNDRIIELAFVHRNYATLQERHFYALVNPQGKKSSLQAYAAHKIPPEMLIDAKPFSELIQDILAFLSPFEPSERTVPIVAHNAQFDFRMLTQELERMGEAASIIDKFPKDRFLCSYQVARRMNGNIKGVNSLSALCEQFDVDLTSRAHCHGAMQDTLLLAELYPHLLMHRV